MTHMLLILSFKLSLQGFKALLFCFHIFFKACEACFKLLKFPLLIIIVSQLNKVFNSKMAWKCYSSAAFPSMPPTGAIS